MVPRRLEPPERKSGLLVVMKHAVVVMALILTGAACTSASSVDGPAASVAIADGPSPSAPAVQATTPPPPRFQGEVSVLDGAARRLVIRRNWHPGCPVKAFVSALGGSRTPNLLIRSQMLYPLSYERLIVASDLRLRDAKSNQTAGRNHHEFTYAP